MTVHNPEPGEVFYDTGHGVRLAYVGTASTGEWITELLDDGQSRLTRIAPSETRHRLVTWTEKLITLEAGQHWLRTRNDYTGMRARVLSVFEHSTTWVVYVTYPDHQGPPKIKAEIDFRRVFGKLDREDRSG